MVEQMAEMMLYYETIAEDYYATAKSGYRLDPCGEERFEAERLVLRNELEQRCGGRCCQLGIGTGDWTRNLAVGADSVVGIEQSPTMVRIARRELSDLSHVQVERRDFTTGSLGGPYDCTALVFVLSILPPSVQADVLAAVAAALKPGGLIFAADSREPSAVAHRGLGRCLLQERMADGRRFILCKEYFPSDSLERLLAAAGFELCEAGTGLRWFQWVLARRKPTG
jgi:SAM-dependent methyltransferase